MSGAACSGPSPERPPRCCQTGCPAPWPLAVGAGRPSCIDLGEFWGARQVMLSNHTTNQPITI